ncbi:hypothetical protein H072_11512 [Dactylellina haptotyla CBS 200.50]|uniref:Uncharacterized protein n=1 Tax=Dactylellina haptotyla (strain CBS 200.50) TaxID=1284197 RepID=S7ZX66_DACHA|nr:hypothetical protein H072_11512 [Dactylellina haptotyla CBS 200.50]
MVFEAGSYNIILHQADEHGRRTATQALGAEKVSRSVNLIQSRDLKMANLNHAAFTWKIHRPQMDGIKDIWYIETDAGKATFNGGWQAFVTDSPKTTRTSLWRISPSQLGSGLYTIKGVFGSPIEWMCENGGVFYTADADRFDAINFEFRRVHVPSKIEAPLPPPAPMAPKNRTLERVDPDESMWGQLRIAVGLEKGTPGLGAGGVAGGKGVHV